MTQRTEILLPTVPTPILWGPGAPCTAAYVAGSHGLGKAVPETA